MDVNQLEQDRQINPSELDLECATQADKFFRWAEAAIEAGQIADQAKLYVDVVKAQLDLECRRRPKDFGIIKVTDASVDAAVKCHKKYQGAVEALNKARKEAKLLDAAVDAMEQKKRMLESLITLHGQQYFAGPSVPRDLVSEWKEYQARSSSAVNSRQRSRSRKRGERRRGQSK